jgi:osmotically-inducible protein OsmY
MASEELRPTVGGPGSEEEPPHYVVQRVREALAHDKRVSELEVKVKVFGRKVFVTGPVSTKARHDAIDEVLAEQLGGYEVHNETQVARLDAPEDVERLS